MRGSVKLHFVNSLRLRWARVRLGRTGFRDRVRPVCIPPDLVWTDVIRKGLIRPGLIRPGLID